METTETYKGIEIEIWHDDIASCPFEDWDGCLPLMYRADRYDKDFSDGQIFKYLANYLTENQIRRNMSKILELIEVDKESFFNEYPSKEYDRVKLVDEMLCEFLDEDIRHKAQFCEAFNIKHYFGTSMGYSQGDWAEVFTCWTPEYEKVSGMSYKATTEGHFEENFKLFGYWAWGDVYGFTIDEVEDSCGGFYGDDHNKSGLMEHAKESIDYHLERRKRVRFDRLKHYIKKGVPYIYRKHAEEPLTFV